MLQEEGTAKKMDVSDMTKILVSDQLSVVSNKQNGEMDKSNRQDTEDTLPHRRRHFANS